MSASAHSEPSAQAAAATIEALRARHQVRPVRSEEEGSAVDALPNGVYGFAYSPGHAAAPLFARNSYHSFEVHKAADGTAYLLGFVTLEEAAELDSGKEGAAVRLYPNARESSQSLVSVPFSRIQSSKRMPREDGNPFPFTTV